MDPFTIATSLLSTTNSPHTSTLKQTSSLPRELRGDTTPTIPAWPHPTCGSQHQSPIDIERSVGCISEKRSLTFSGSCADFNVSLSDESFTSSVSGGSCAVTANGASYDMLQFHMHVPSEHTLNGEYLGGEVHSNAESEGRQQSV